MNLITRTQHAYFDAATVLVFALAPIVIGLEGAAAGLSYALAGVHLLMSLLTSGLPGSPGRLISLPLHGLLEAVVGIALAVIGWLGLEGGEQLFFLVMAGLILLVFALTPYLDQST